MKEICVKRREKGGQRGKKVEMGECNDERKKAKTGGYKKEDL